MEAFQPLYDRVLMEFITEEKTAGGILIAQNAQEKMADRVRVVAVGPGKYDVDTKERVPMNIKKGDIVFVNPYLGMRVKVAAGTRPLLVQKEDEILGVASEAEGG